MPRLAYQASGASGQTNELAPGLTSPACDETTEPELEAASSDRRAEERLYAAAFDCISDGVCLFDAQNRLLACNRRYAEIYRLTPEQVRPGVTVREIAELRIAAGTSPLGTDDGLSYAAWCRGLTSPGKPSTWTIALKDGRSIKIHHRPMPDGCWVATHAVTTGQAGSAAANTPMSLADSY